MNNAAIKRGIGGMQQWAFGTYCSSLNLLLTYTLPTSEKEETLWSGNEEVLNFYARCESHTLDEFSLTHSHIAQHTAQMLIDSYGIAS